LPKIFAKKLAFLTRTKLNFEKNLIITLVFKKNAIFGRKLGKTAEICDHNIDPWGRFLVHFFQGKFRGKFSPQKCWEKIAIFRGKSFEKSFFSTNSTEFSAENHFPGKKCTKNWPQVVFLDTPGVVSKEEAEKFGLEESLLVDPVAACHGSDLILVLQVRDKLFQRF
jgi:hypothetical protein